MLPDVVEFWFCERLPLSVLVSALPVYCDCTSPAASLRKRFWSYANCKDSCVSFSRSRGMDRSKPCELDGPLAFNAMYSEAMRLY